MSNINIGIIGAGWISEKYLDIVYGKRMFNLYGITSRTLNKALKLKKKYKIKNIYKNYKIMLNDENIDGFILLVSAENIYKITIDLIKNKKPFLVEKPVFLQQNKKNQILNLLKKYKTKNMVALNRRYYSIFKNGLKILHKNCKILGIVVEGHERFYNIKKQDYNKEVYENWIYANSVHTIDLLRFFGGDIKEINTLNTKLNIRKTNYSANILFKNGVIGNYYSFWNSPGGWSVTIFADGITLIFKPLEQGFYLHKNMIMKKIKIDKVDMKYKTGFFLMLKDFKKLILNQKLSDSFQDIQNHTKTIDLISIINNG